MISRKFLHLVISVLVVASLLIGGGGQASAQAPNSPNGNAQMVTDKDKDKDKNKITHADRKAAAARALKQGALNPLMVVDAAAAPLIGGAPHYFSHPNYANSPLPTVNGAPITVGNVSQQDRAYASDYPVNPPNLAPVFVVNPAPLPNGFLTSFQTWNQATPGGSPFPSEGNVFHAYVLRPTLINPNEYTVVFDSGLLQVPAPTTLGTSEVATFPVANLAVQANDVIAFYGQGIPVDTGAGSDVMHYPAAQPLQDSTITLGSTDYPIYPQPRTYSFGAQVLDMTWQNVTISGGLKKFVDPLPRFGVDIPAAVSETPLEAYDTYTIGLVQYRHQFHSDLGANPALVRGYVQLSTNVVPGAQVLLTNAMVDGTEVPIAGFTGVTAPSYLGPAIVAQKNRPVRIVFYNLLPTDAGGNLFIPVDTTVMGSGSGPDMANMTEPDPQNPMCGMWDGVSPKPAGCYSENRATLHLHGGITPWISDGTAHQWITPANETTSYPQGVSVQNVPDMNVCGAANDGCQTFYYTNQQSARLMFYHDHAYGITRLNVYAGEAAGYVLTDPTEGALVANGIIPSPLALADDTIPLVIQDKTFVPGAAQLAATDETWDVTRWGGEGNLWAPHVYSPAQNPGDASGVNQYGRWAYGPWFWPPTNGIENGPILNPYYDPNCNPDLGWCEPYLMPGTPYVSMGMEDFQDTPVVNGTAYPTITLDPKPYRFRILNAANARFFNLQLYKAIDANGVLCDTANANPALEKSGVPCTEVRLNPAEVAAALLDPAGVFPTPDPLTAGPSWIQIGTESGFLPSPVVIPNQPTTWVTDPTVFNAGNVDQHSLLLGPAERADVIVDLSNYGGQYLILYNDAPAAFPARDPRYDYYTGNADLRDTGGAPSTLPGYGPNTRTVMQIYVNPGNLGGFNLANLQAAFAHHTDANGNPAGVFESSQSPIIVGQGPYTAAYGTPFTNSEGLVQIYDTSLSFRNILGANLTINLKPKMIQDEMGEAFEIKYGRMSGNLGVETANAQAGLQNMILYNFADPPTEVFDGVEVPVDANGGLVVTPIATADDGTQIWKITHNGVDTHPMHWHMYEVQLINRVGWDGIIRKPDANELGWKDTVRVSPLEDTIVALRPIIPVVPFDLPNNIRLLDPTMPENAVLKSATQALAEGRPVLSFNPDGQPIDIFNHYVNFGWEYTWHCHILNHEEMDMMRTQATGLAPKAPTFIGAVVSGTGSQRTYTVTWTDESRNETAFVIQRSSSPTGPWSILATIPSDRLTVGPGTGTRTYVDRTRNTFYYQVYAINVIGDTWDYSDPAINNIPPGGGFPTMTLTSLPNAQPPAPTLVAPTNLTASAVVKNRKTATVTLTWDDPAANNETGFLVQRALNATFTSGVVNTTVGPNITTLKQDVARGTIFYYRVHAFDSTTQSAWSNTATVTTP